MRTMCTRSMRRAGDEAGSGRWRGFTLIEVLVVIAVIAILIALMLPLSRGGSRQAAWRAQCTNNMKQIALALANYEASYRCLPPVYTVDANGKPLHSWRALILPFLDEKDIHDSIDFTRPWDDPANSRARDSIVSVFRCPAGSGSTNMTAYLAVVGPGSCFVPGKPRALGEVWYGDQAPMMLIEAGEKDAVPWMEPRDATESMVLTLGSARELPHPGGTNVAFGDGSVRFMSESMTEVERKAMIAGSGVTGSEVGRP